MINNYLLTCFLSILIFIVVNTVAREAIVNYGDKAGIDEFPYQVALIHNGENFCDGGIIGDQFVLTAAHCFLSTDGKFDDLQISIRAGTNDFRKTNPPAMTVEIIKVYVLKNYLPDDPEKLGDIAVLKLKHRLQLSKHLEKLDLPRDEESFVGKKAVIAGFGQHWKHRDGSKSDGGQNDTQLRFAEVDVLNHIIYDDERFDLPDQLIHEKVKQVNRRKPRGVCIGDSGSALVYGKTVIGILSRASVDCLEREMGGMYVIVSHYLDFIHNAMHDNFHKDIRVYQIHH